MTTDEPSPLPSLILRLPVELWQRVMRSCRAKELANLKKSCRHFHQILPVEEILEIQREYEILVLWFPTSPALRRLLTSTKLCDDRTVSDRIERAIGTALDDCLGNVAHFFQCYWEQLPHDLYSSESPWLEMILECMPVDVAADLFFSDKRLIDSSMAEKQQLLLAATRYGHATIVRRLIQEHSVPDLHALGIAAEQGNIEIVDMLLQVGTYRNTPGLLQLKDALRSAAGRGHKAVVERLLASDPTPDLNDALKTACSNGHMDVVDWLLGDARTDPTVHDHKALFEAAHKGHIAVVERLLSDARVNPAARNCAILVELATWDRHQLLAKLLREDGQRIGRSRGKRTSGRTAATAA